MKKAFLLAVPLVALALCVSAYAQDRTFLDQYCVTCHNERTKTAGLMLDKLDVGHAGDNAETWEKVVRKLRTGMMPPSGARRPERSAIDAFTSGLENTLDHAAAAKPNPGTTALHRLNRTEYGNAIRDLLALPIDAATLLPPDDSAEGFDNVADVLGVSPLLIQGYVSAATKISRLAVGDPEMSADKVTYRIPRGLGQADHIEGLPLGTRGGMLIQHTFPLDGEYDFRIARSGVGVGQTSVGGDEEIEISVNGQRVYLVDRNSPRDVRLVMKAGPQSIGVAVLKKRNIRGVDDLYDTYSATLGVSTVSITGPFNAAGPGETASRQRIFVCHPSGASDELPCAKQILRTLAGRAFRQPVAESDVAMETLLGFYQTGRKQGTFETGIEHALARILVDPRFLYRFEREPANLAAGASYRVSDIELASRLSFFIWSSIPDDELVNAAVQGQLKQPAVLERQVRRMLADPRAEALSKNFGSQWLYLRDLKNAKPEADDFDENLRQSIRRETELMLDHIVRSDRSIVELINADYTFVDERLARHYGIPNIRGSQFRRVTLEKDDPRRGLLGKASFLIVTSAANRTSPVSRGKWVLENILGVSAPAVPASVPPLKENTERTDGKVLSMRERMEEHRSNPACASCHKIMDPIGFALENFDLTGKWRTVDEKSPVDASGVLVDGTKLNGPGTLRDALVGRSDAFVSNATEKLLTYAMGRPVHYYDMPVVRSIIHDAARNDYRFSALVLGIVKSAPFQMKVKMGS
jgi:cytochrome c551/c552